MKGRTANKKLRFCCALGTFLLLAAAMFLATVKYGAEPQLPLALGCVAAALSAKITGWKWEDILRHMLDGVTQSLEALLILMAIGILIGALISCGAVPTVICYGLRLISARYFLVTAFLICALISMAVGSWGTAGTVGLAFMGIGRSLGLPAAMVAGAIVSGAYVGDKASPFSDSTNLAAAVSGCDVFTAVRHMFPLVGPVAAAAALIFLFTGGASAQPVSAPEIQAVLNGLESSFRISWATLLPLALLFACILLRVPALPSLAAGAGAAALTAVFMQGRTAGELLEHCFSGFGGGTAVPELNGLLSTGGLGSMANTILLIIIAMAFGGIMHGTGQTDALMEPLVRRIRSLPALTAALLLSCIGVNIVMPDQYLGISLPGQLFRGEYEKRGVPSHVLVNTLGAGAAVTSPLVPWNSCGLYMSTMLGVGAAAYARHAWFCLLMPAAMLLYSALLSKKYRAK